MKKRWPGRIFTILAVIAAFFVLILLLLHTPLAGKWVFYRIGDYVRRSAKIDLQANRVQLNLFTGSVSLENLSVRDAQSPELPTVFEADHIYTKLNMLEAFRGKWIVEDLIINKPRVHYFIGPDGKTNLPGTEGSSNTKLDLMILQAGLTDGTFQLEDRQRDLSILLPRLKLTIGGDPQSGAHRIDFSIQQESTLAFQDISIPISSLDFSGVLADSSLRIDSLRSAAAGSTLSLTGAIRNFSAPELDLELTPSLNAAGIAEAANYIEGIAGNIAGSVRIRGPLETVRIATRLEGSDVRFPKLPPLDFHLDADMEWDAAAEKLTIQSFGMDSQNGSLSATGTLFAQDSAENNSIQARLYNVNLQPFGRRFQLPFDLASRVGGTVSMQWNGKPTLSDLRCSAALNLTATRPAPEALPISLTVNLNLQSNQLRGQIQSLSVLGMKASGGFVIRSFREIEGSLKGEVSDINYSMQELARFLGKPEKIPLSVKTDRGVNFDVQAAGELNRMELVVTLDAPSLEVAGLRHLSTQARAVLRDSRITFQSNLMFPGNARIEAQGDLDLGSEVPLLHLIAESASPMPVSSINAVLERRIPMAGTLETSLHLDGPADNLTGDLTIAGENLSLYEIPLGQLDILMDLTGQEIRSSRFQLIRNPLNPSTDLLTARLFYALDSSRFELEAEGTNLVLEPGSHPGGAPINGTLDLHVSGTGTLENPSIDVTLRSNDLWAWQKPLGPVSVNALLRDKEIELQALAPRIQLFSNATIINSDPYPFQVAIEARNSDLSTAGLQWRQQPVTGYLKAEIEGSGNLKALEQSQIDARVENLQLQAGELQVHTEAPAHINYRDRSIEISPSITLVGSKSTIELTGRLPVLEAAPDGAIGLKARLDLGDAEKLISTPEGYDIEGILNFDVTVAGAYRDLKIVGGFTMDGGSILIPQATAPMTDTTVRARIEGGALVLEQATANWGTGNIAISGTMPLGLLPESPLLGFSRKTGPAQFILNMENLTPELMGFLPNDISGLVSLHVEGEAERPDLQALNADIQFRDLAFKVDTMAFSQEDSSRIFLRNGVAFIERLVLRGPETNIKAAGSAGLYPRGPLNLQVSGSINAGLLGSISENLKTTGDMQIDAAITGELDAPVLSGYAEMQYGKLSLNSPRIAVDDLNVRLHLDSEEIAIREFTGVLNGGTMSIEGSVGYRHGIYNDIDLKASLEDVFLNAPEGLKSASSGNLTMKSEEETIVIGGSLRILESTYRESIEVGGQLIDYLKSQQAVIVGEEPNPFLDRIRFDVSVSTATPLLVQNNVARVEAMATSLRLVGSYNEPSVTGRITLNEGGEIVLNQRTYYINRGAITLVNQNRIEPEFNIQAQTKVDIYEITLQLTGNPERLSTVLSSDPPLSERDILSVLLTGKTVSETRGREMQMVRTQALSLIAGQAGEGITSEARRALGLSTLRIDPGLIASESNPGARLTIGEDITRKFGLVYSMNLVDGGDQIWAAHYDIGRRLTTQATKQQDNSYRFEFRHDLRFGGEAVPQSSRQGAAKFEIGSIQFHGAGLYSENVLLDKFKNRPGDRYDFQKVQKGLDRLHDFLSSQNHLEADIRLQRNTGEKTVDLIVSIDPGPVVEFEYGQYRLEKKVKDLVAKAWVNGVFEAERLEEASLAIRRALTEDGFLQAEISADLDEADGQRRVRFHINPGTRYKNVPIYFPGASSISPGMLNSLLNGADLTREVYVNPKKVVDFLDRYYRDRGYLQVEVRSPEFRPNPATGTAETEIEVREGPLFFIGDLEFSGNAVFSYDELWMVIPTSSGTIYNPDSLRESIKEIENLYHGKGYNDVSATYRVLQDSQNAKANVTFQITERRQWVIRDIAVEGNQSTSQIFVSRQLDFRVGDPLDYEKINETRRRLYATGAYTTVDFQMEELPGAVAASSGQKNMRVRLQLHETQPYRLQYGLFFDTDRGIGGLLETQHMNFLGRATNLGFRVRYDSNLKEGRLYYHQPFVTQLHLKLDASAFWQKETRSFFSAKRIGFSLIQERELPKEYRLDYGYRYDHVRWNGLPLDPIIFQASVPVARLIATLTRDTRDSILDPTRGEFTSHTFEFGPRWLGSEIGFARYSGQYFRYVPLNKYLGKPIVDRKGQPLPTNFVYAGALRLGLTSPFGKTSVISPERFFAGGGTTMRGFAQDLLGPLETQPDGTQRPTGGEAMFLFNNEIRFPIVGILQGVGFLDIGNVYAKLTDFDFNLRKTAGIGLRLKIRSIPLRFDYGFKLDRKPGESGGEFFFSIGQAF